MPALYIYIYVYIAEPGIGPDVTRRLLVRFRVQAGTLNRVQAGTLNTVRLLYEFGFTESKGAGQYRREPIFRCSLTSAINRPTKDTGTTGNFH